MSGWSKAVSDAASSEIDDINTLLRQHFQKAPDEHARLFLCCVSGKEVAILEVNIKTSSRTRPTVYSNTFIPTICGCCQKREARGPFSFEERNPNNDFPVDLKIKLDDDMLRDWRVFKSIVKHCDGEIRVVRQIMDRSKLLKDLQNRDYQVQMYTGRPKTASDGKNAGMEVSPYLDAGFL